MNRLQIKIVVVILIGLMLDVISYHAMSTDPINYTNIVLTRYEQGWETPVFVLGYALWLLAMVYAGLSNLTNRNSDSWDTWIYKNAYYLLIPITILNLIGLYFLLK